jgi:hypothetical protein
MPVAEAEVAGSPGADARRPAAPAEGERPGAGSLDSWAAELMALAGCARREAPGTEQVVRVSAVADAGLDSSSHRLLMGRGPAGAEARLSIDAGPLAGTSIHLREGPRGIEAAVLTQVACSRQTLVAALDEVARRLREKGHNLTVQLQGGASTREGRYSPEQTGR